MCLNKKCEFVSKPTRILWTCMVCKTEFKSGAIPYNPLDGEVTRRLISQTLLLKHKAVFLWGISPFTFHFSLLVIV